MKNKLVSLNLALFMIVASVIPAFATDNNKENIMMEQQSYLSQYDMIDMSAKNKNERLSLSVQEDAKDNAGVELYSSKSSGYNIVVGGNSFSSIYNAKGKGWEYYAEDNALFLDGYTGSGIRASGDLVIYASGVNRITGSTSTNYGSDGIMSSGNLDVIIINGTTTINGGHGFYQGGDGIYSGNYAFVYTFSGASLIVEGGDTAEPSTAGGNAIFGVIAHISGAGFVRAIGGDGTSVYSNGCAGGCALIGDEVYVEGSCELIGGEGYYAGPGIYFRSYCEMGVVNATISCGNGQKGKYAIQNSKGLDWYYNNHTILSGSSSSFKISIRQYTLRLLGCGGTRGTATFESLKAYYPTSYDLSEYRFQRIGYTQCGWLNASGDLVPLNTLYTPEGDTALYAEWAPNTYKVIYNSNGGSGSMSVSSHTYGIEKNLISCAFAKTGYKFVGWATTPSGSVVYSDGASVKNLTTTNGGTVTLYAIWQYTPEIILSTTNGAQIRTTGNQGLRFVSSIDKTSLDFSRVVEFGTVMLPTEFLSDISQLQIGAVVGGAKVGKIQALNLYSEDDESITFTAVLTNIKEMNYAREYSARAYAILDDGTVVYADTGASRSIYEVAKRGLESTTESDANKEVYQAIIDVVENA